MAHRLCTLLQMQGWPPHCWPLGRESYGETQRFHRRASGHFSLWLTSVFCHLLTVAAAAAAKSLQSCPTLCDPIDCNPPGSAFPGILQARTLEWVAISFSRGSSQARDGTRVSCIAGRFLTTESSRTPSALVNTHKPIRTKVRTFFLTRIEGSGL